METRAKRRQVGFYWEGWWKRDTSQSLKDEVQKRETKRELVRKRWEVERERERENQVETRLERQRKAGGFDWEGWWKGDISKCKRKRQRESW